MNDWTDWQDQPSHEPPPAAAAEPRPGIRVLAIIREPERHRSGTGPVYVRWAVRYEWRGEVRTSASWDQPEQAMAAVIRACKEAA